MKHVDIYTDGACSGNQNETNIGGWGCVLRYGKHEKELCGGEVDTTNNRMELTALIEALSALKQKALDISIFSDSSYLVNCFRNRWYEKWVVNGWKTSGKKPVENRELWEKLLELTNGNRTRFFLVKGHLDPEAPEEKLEKAYARFTEHNGDSFSFAEFRAILRANNRCDELANVFINETRAQSAQL